MYFILFLYALTTLITLYSTSRYLRIVEKSFCLLGTLF